MFAPLNYEKDALSRYVEKIDDPILRRAILALIGIKYGTHSCECDGSFAHATLSRLNEMAKEKLNG